MNIKLGIIKIRLELFRSTLCFLLNFKKPTDKIVIYCSQKLDEVIVKYYKVKIINTEIDSLAFKFTGTYPTIIINQNDVPGVINNVTAILFEEKINIAFMKVYRNNKGRDASMLIEVDSVILDNIIKQIAQLPDVNRARFINPVRA